MTPEIRIWLPGKTIPVTAESDMLADERECGACTEEYRPTSSCAITCESYCHHTVKRIGKLVKILSPSSASYHKEHSFEKEPWQPCFQFLNTLWPLFLSHDDTCTCGLLVARVSVRVCKVERVASHTSIEDANFLCRSKCWTLSQSFLSNLLVRNTPLNHKCMLFA